MHGKFPDSPLAWARLGAVLALAVSGNFAGSVATAATSAITWVCSTESAPSRSMPAPELAAGADTPPELRLAPDRAYQTIDGFGGCFIQPGARRILCTGVWGDRIAFANPDGSLVAVVGNSSDREHGFRLGVGGRPGPDTLSVTLPARSVSTFVLPPPAS